MNFAGFHFSFAQLVTSLLGLSLGICVTLVPNISQMVWGKKMKFGHITTLQLRYYPMELAERIANVLTHSINFLTNQLNLIGTLGSEIDEIDPVIQTMQAAYNASTWKRLLFHPTCRYERWKDECKHVRRFTDAFKDNIGGFDDLFHMVKKVMLSDDH